MSIRINPRHRIIADICIEIQTLRVAQFGVRHWHDLRTPVWRGEAADCGVVVPCEEVVVVGLAVAFLLREVVFGGVVGGGGRVGWEDGSQSVAEGQTDPAHLDLAGDVGLHALGSERVGQLVVQAERVIGCGQPRGGKDVGVLPDLRRSSRHSLLAQLRHLVAALVHKIPRR